MKAIDNFLKTLFLLILVVTFSSASIFTQEQPETQLGGFVFSSKAKAPISNVLLKLFFNKVEIAETTTGFDGVYLFDHLNTGSYTIELSAPGYHTKEYCVKIDDLKEFEKEDIYMVPFDTHMLLGETKSRTPSAQSTGLKKVSNNTPKPRKKR